MQPSMTERVVLVDEQDREIGTEDKLEVHRQGRLHRAVSVFVFDGGGRLMLQRRDDDKYHCGGLWSNTCCTHPRPGETAQAAAMRRTVEEMGFTCELAWQFAAIYRAEVSADLIEHEYDHVFVGHFDGEPVPHPTEVSDWRMVAPNALSEEMAREPDSFTPWLRILWSDVRNLRVLDG